MAFDIYKKGQGKYTRIITFVAVMFLGVIGGVQLSAQLSRLPDTLWGLQIKVYLQYGIPTVVVVVLGLVMFWIVNRQKSADFLIETEGEMKKVSWSTMKEIVGSTKVVIVTTFIMATILFCTDWAFLQLFGAIGVQEF